MFRILKSFLTVNLKSIATLRKVKYLLEKIKFFGENPHDVIIKYLMADNNIDTIIDVGANIGQFGIDMRNSGFSGQIISFEPGSNEYAFLSKNSKKRPPWESMNLALGSANGRQILNVSGNDGLSSSFYSIEPIHLDNFPTSRITRTEEVLISTLDRQIEHLKLDPKKMLLKLDVQGYELEVLRGSRKNLSQIPFCFLEVSLIPLYKEEKTLLPVLTFLADYGHYVIDIYRGTRGKKGELLQIDVLTRGTST